MAADSGNWIDQQKLPTSIYIRDPVHDIIRIEDRVIRDILNSRPMQRLRRIRQLGTAFLVYPGAEHTRFAHSLGVYHLAGRMLRQLKGNRPNSIKESDELIIQLAALLHDVGHGPFSHLFETVLKAVSYKHYQKHEKWTQQIIYEHDEITQILDKYDPVLKGDVKAVIANTSPNGLWTIVSSQLDVDRFDYMLRDSLMTGVNYGRFDLNWMLRNLSLEEVESKDEDNLKEKESRVVLEAKRGLSSVEEFLLGNLNLYEHVYFHKTVQAAAAMIQALLHRAIDLMREENNNVEVDNLALTRIAKNEKMSVDEYLSLNDGEIISWIALWARESKDPVLQEISASFMARTLFKSRNVTELSKEQYVLLKSKLKNRLESKGIKSEFLKYYIIPVNTRRIGYEPISADEIWILGSDNKTRKYSSIIAEEGHSISKAIVSRLKVEKDLLFVPARFERDLKELAKEVES